MLSPLHFLSTTLYQPIFLCIRLSSTRKGGFGSTADRLALVDDKEDLPGMYMVTYLKF